MMRLAFAAVAVVAAGLLACSGPPEREVVLYTSIDQLHAEPILKRFESQAGVRVRAVFDLEAAKSTGLANRLLAERAAPRADLFWSGEVAQILRLKSEGALEPHRPESAAEVAPDFRDPENGWTGSGLRGRVLLVNTDRVAPGQEPQTLEALLSESWKPGEVGIANPLFGTSATHMAALYVVWGPEKARAFYAGLLEGGCRVLPGNSTVRDLVVSGELAVGLTDTDDAQSAVDAGAPVKVIYPDEGVGGTLYIPSAIALVAGGPNPEEGRRLAEYLTSATVEQDLIATKFFCASVRKPPPGLRVSWGDLARVFESSRADASALFLK